MKLTRAKGTGQPMVYVTTRSSMLPDDIAARMGELFNRLELFFGESSVRPAGPPLAIYRDWDGDGMTIEVGFPVAQGDLAKAHGDVLAGHAPQGDAAKVLHRGSYDTLRDTYGEMEQEMKRLGIAMGPLAWEVYLGDPGKTPEEDLLTEIYMAVSPEDAARMDAA